VNEGFVHPQQRGKEITKENQTIRYEDIENSSAEQLLELSNEQLDCLIVQAWEKAREAHTTKHWLNGIKTEKAIRENLDDAGKEVEG